MFDDIIPSVNRNLGIEFEGTELKKQGNPVEDCMIAAQQVQYFQSVFVKVVDIYKAIRILFAGPFSGHLLDTGTVKASSVVIVWITDIDIRNLDDVIRSVK